MSQHETTKSSTEIICDLSDMVTQKRAQIVELRAALRDLLQVCEEADREESVFPQQMEAARKALANV